MKNRFKEETGVAMITVVVLSAVLMMLGGGMYFVASREHRMTQADFAGGQAFYYAEGGIENAIDIINYAGTETQLTRQRPDQSSDGYGYLMDPIAEYRQEPPVERRIAMQIGNEAYTVWVNTIRQDPISGEWVSCTNCGLNLTTTNPSYLLITAESDAGGDGDHRGYRRLQQRVKVVASGYPMSLFIDGDVTGNGSANLTNQSIYVRGNLWGREKLVASGEDLVYDGTGGQAAVFATGEIHDSANDNIDTEIYVPRDDPGGGLPNAPNWDPSYVNDRDYNGLVGETFDPKDLNALFDTGGLNASQLLTLKGMAQTSGFYRSLSAGSNLVINQQNLPDYDGQSIVVYVEYASGDAEDNDVSIRFSWPNAPGSPGQVFIIVRNGSVQMSGNIYINGSVYCKDGPVEVHGNGGLFTGFVWGKGMVDIGNWDFNMTPEFLEDPPFFTWTVLREAAWSEVEDID